MTEEDIVKRLARLARSRCSKFPERSKERKECVEKEFVKLQKGKRVRGGHSLLNTALMGACLIGIIVIGGMVATGKFMSTTIYELPPDNEWENPETEGLPYNLVLRFGFPIIAGVYPNPAAPGEFITMGFVMDPIYPEPVFRIELNATWHIDVLECFFFTTEITLNRALPTQQYVYYTPDWEYEIEVDMLETNEITTTVNTGTYFILSSYSWGGAFRGYNVVGAVRNYFDFGIFNWLDLNIVIDPIYIYPEAITTYNLGIALVLWAIGMF